MSELGLKRFSARLFELVPLPCFLSVTLGGASRNLRPEDFRGAFGDRPQAGLEGWLSTAGRSGGGGGGGYPMGLQS